MNNRKKIATFCILLYLFILIISVVTKVDHFPLTWGPMFSNAPTQKNEYSVAIPDFREMKKGIEVEYLDGTKTRINHQDLNIPYQLGTIMDGYFGIYRLLVSICDETDEDYGLIPITTQLNRKKKKRKMMHQILMSLNKTLGNNFGDPKFVINLSVTRSMMLFSQINTQPRATKTLASSLISCQHLTQKRRFKK